MKSFLKYTLATIFGVFISFIFIGVLLFFTVLGLINSGTEGKVNVKSNSVLELNLDYEIQERGSQAFLSLLNPEMGESFLGLDNLLEIINRAKNDPKIKGIYLKTNLNNSGYATLSEVRNALKDFKSKGKFIYAMAPYYDEKNYYLASIADSVFIEKTGNILLNGLSANVMFYKGAFEKLGIEMQYVKVGAYKGAIESFTREELSPENREQISLYIHQLYHNLIAEIGESRQVDTHQLRMAIDQFTIQSPKDAFNFGLIDGLTYQDDVHNKIRKAIGIKDTKNKHYIKASSYLNSGESEKNTSSDKIAVVYAVGEIVDGQGNNNSIGSTSLAKVIIKAREDKDIKAIVLRVNSPGGSALASDIITREIALCKGKKPIIVSMGDVAASGGYYISCLADTILASSNSLTGSIGVFGLFPNMQKLFNEKLGLTIESVKTGQYSDFGRVDKPLSDGERMYLQQMVNRIYDDFTTIVEKGRGIDSAELEKYAQGHVWIAKHAMERGLVDRIGGINDAIKMAAKMANLKTYKMVSFPQIEDPITQLFNQGGNEIINKKIAQDLGIFHHYYQSLLSGIQSQGFQTRLPYELFIH